MRSNKPVALIVCGAVLVLGLSQPLYAQERSVPPPAASTSYTSQTLPFDLSTATPVSGQVSGLSTISLLRASLGARDPVSATFVIINLLLTLLGLFFLGLMIYAGVIWVLARGNEEEIGRAKDIIRRALFGLVIVMSSYGISYLLFYLIGTQTGITVTP